MIERYIKIEWPDSQKFQLEEYEDSCYWCNDMVVFVPEDIYLNLINED